MINLYLFAIAIPLTLWILFYFIINVYLKNRCIKQIKKLNIDYKAGYVFNIPTTNRQLGYNIYGENTPELVKRTVLFFHGAPGSRFELYSSNDDNAIKLYKKYGLRIICVERPGYGFSTPHNVSEGRTHLTVANDILLLMQHLNINECSLIGFSSAGGLLHHLIYLVNNNKSYSNIKILSATFIACQGPLYHYPNEIKKIKLKKTSWWKLVSFINKYNLWFLLYLQQYYNQFLFLFNPKAALTSFYGKKLCQNNPNLQNQLLHNLSAIYLQSYNEPTAVLDDFKTAFLPWPFDITKDNSNNSKNIINYSFWHGKRDVMRPYEVSAWQAQCVKEYKNCGIVKEHYLEGVGHAVHLYWEYWNEMIEEIMSFR